MALIAASLVHDGIAVVGTVNAHAEVHSSPIASRGRLGSYTPERLCELLASAFHHHFLFGASDEVVHTGFPAMSHHLIGLACRPRHRQEVESREWRVESEEPGNDPAGRSRVGG